MTQTEFMHSKNSGRQRNDTFIPVLTQSHSETFNMEQKITVLQVLDCPNNCLGVIKVKFYFHYKF